jgi:Holliday junction resolvase RusA-like endonuclease
MGFKKGEKITARVYNTGDTDEWKEMIKLYARRHVGCGYFWECAEVRIIFHMPRPKQHLDRHNQLKHFAPTQHTLRPDLVNLVKPVLDALTDSDAFWHDDGVIHDLSLSKVYSLSPGIHVTIQRTMK